MALLCRTYGSLNLQMVVTTEMGKFVLDSGKVLLRSGQDEGGLTG